MITLNNAVKYATGIHINTHNNNYTAPIQVHISANKEL